MKLVKLTQNKEAFVDDEDYEYISKWKWYYKQGYACRNIPDNGKQKTVLMHTCIIHCPMYKDIDHINRNKLDNQRENLRLATRSENQINSSKKIGSSGLKGVLLKKGRTKYHSLIEWKKRKIFIGSYHTKEEAANMYNLYAYQLYGEFAYLNSVPL